LEVPRRERGRRRRTKRGGVPEREETTAAPPSFLHAGFVKDGLKWRRRIRRESRKRRRAEVTGEKGRTAINQVRIGNELNLNWQQH